MVSQNWWFITEFSFTYCVCNVPTISGTVNKMYIELSTLTCFINIKITVGILNLYVRIVEFRTRCHRFPPVFWWSSAHYGFAVVALLEATGPRDGATPPQDISPREVPPTGWAALGLTYKVQWPLHILFTPAVLEKYVLVIICSVQSGVLAVCVTCSLLVSAGTMLCSGTCWAFVECSLNYSTAGLSRCRGNTWNPPRWTPWSGDYATTWPSWLITCSITYR